MEQYSFNFTEGDTACFGRPKLFSNLLIERILEELGLMNFFSAYKGFTKIQYDVYSFMKLMVFGRILNPASKLATTRQNDDYYEPVRNPNHIKAHLLICMIALTIMRIIQNRIC